MSVLAPVAPRTRTHRRRRCVWRRRRSLIRHQDGLSGTTAQSYTYSPSGNATTAGNLTLAYDSSDRPLLITNLTPQNLATAIQHHAPEGWRDSKLGRYAYDQKWFTRNWNQASAGTSP